MTLPLVQHGGLGLIGELQAIQNGMAFVFVKSRNAVEVWPESALILPKQKKVAA